MLGSFAHDAAALALREIPWHLQPPPRCLPLTSSSATFQRARAYVIGYSGKIPAGTTLLLGVPDAVNAIDVTHQQHHHLIDERNLSHFLSLIGNAGWWGTTGRCRLFLRSGSSIAPVSNEVIFD